MKLRVECYAGRKAGERPVYLFPTPDEPEGGDTRSRVSKDARTGNRNPLNLVERDLITRAVVEFRRARGIHAPQSPARSLSSHRFLNRQ